MSVGQRTLSPYSLVVQKGCWLLFLSLKRLKAGMRYEIEFRMDDQAVLFA
jgi:hypothetical protein